MCEGTSRSLVGTLITKGDIRNIAIMRKLRVKISGGPAHGQWSNLAYKQLAATKASKVWFSYSHNCTLADGAVFHSVCQVRLSSGPSECVTLSYCAWLWKWLIIIYSKHYRYRIFSISEDVKLKTLQSYPALLNMCRGSLMSAGIKDSHLIGPMSPPKDAIIWTEPSFREMASMLKYLAILPGFRAVGRKAYCINYISHVYFLKSLFPSITTLFTACITTSSAHTTLMKSFAFHCSNLFFLASYLYLIILKITWITRHYKRWLSLHWLTTTPYHSFSLFTGNFKKIFFWTQTIDL